MQIENIISDILESNTYILKKDGEALIVDCGCTLDKVENAVGVNKVVGVLLTHGHYDHSINCNEYAKKFGCKIYANAMAAETVTDFEANYSDDKSVIEDLSNFVFIEKDMTLVLGNFQVECISAPGHCHCCECYLVEGNLFAGDVLFVYLSAGEMRHAITRSLFCACETVLVLQAFFYFMGNPARSTPLRRNHGKKF